MKLQNTSPVNCLASILVVLATSACGDSAESTDTVAQTSLNPTLGAIVAIDGTEYRMSHIMSCVGYPKLMAQYSVFIAEKPGTYAYRGISIHVTGDPENAELVIRDPRRWVAFRAKGPLLLPPTESGNVQLSYSGEFDVIDEGGKPTGATATGEAQIEC